MRVIYALFLLTAWAAYDGPQRWQDIVGFAVGWAVGSAFLWAADRSVGLPAWWRW